MSEMEAIIIELESVEVALNLITVNGERNLDRLLGSIQTVRKAKNKLKEIESHANQNEQG